MASNELIIDGSVLEGGGQILRNAVALSGILGIPVIVNNIRAGRSKPGLRPQHLTGLQLIRDLCNGRLDGAYVESTEVSFQPGRLVGGTFTADTKTAGSICLLIQAALPCVLFSNGPTRLMLKGGTNAEMAPQIDYLTWVFQPMIERFGIRFDCHIKKRGFFPKGGGEVRIATEPVRFIRPVNITDVGHLTRVTGRAFTAGVLPVKIAQNMARAAQELLQRHYGDVPIHIDALKENDIDAFGNGTGIIVMAETSTGCRLAGSALGKKGVPAEEVGRDAAGMLVDNLSHGGCVDEFLQDQVIILMALAKGKSQITCGQITVHTQTSIHIAETLTKAKFQTRQLEGDRFLIECDGIGAENMQIC